MVPFYYYTKTGVVKSMKIATSDILTAFQPKGVIGTKVLDSSSFLSVLEKHLVALEDAGFTKEMVPGQAFLDIPALIPYVSAGVGKKSLLPSDYVLREHRGRVGAYLRRMFAARVESCGVVVYTRDAYLRNPDITQEESARIIRLDPTHVLVAVLASAGPTAPLTPYRFVANLAGGNRAALVWSADEIRARAKEIITYSEEWAVVADPEE